MLRYTARKSASVAGKAMFLDWSYGEGMTKVIGEEEGPLIRAADKSLGPCGCRGCRGDKKDLSVKLRCRNTQKHRSSEAG